MGFDKIQNKNKKRKTITDLKESSTRGYKTLFFVVASSKSSGYEESYRSRQTCASKDDRHVLHCLEIEREE